MIRSNNNSQSSVFYVLLRTLLALDIKVSNKLASKCVKLRFFLQAFEYIGNGWTWLAVAFYFYLKSNDDLFVIKMVKIFMFGFTLDLCLIGPIKFTVKRKRPKMNVKEGEYTFKADQYSFPSGHASRAIFISNFVCMYFSYRNVPFFNLVVSLLGWSTAVSRVLMSRHYVIDVVFGIVVGKLNFYITSLVSSYL